jgi:hypothetical protein
MIKLKRARVPRKYNTSYTLIKYTTARRTRTKEIGGYDSTREGA